MKKVMKKMSKNSLKAVAKACIISHCEKMPYDINRQYNLVHGTGRVFRYPENSSGGNRWWPEYEDTLDWCR